MAALLPAQKGTAGYVPPGSIYVNHASNTPNTLTAGRIEPVSGLRHQVWFFDDVDNNQDWIQCPGVVAVAFWHDDFSEGSAPAPTLRVNRNIRFNSPSNDQQGWLHTWSKGQRVLRGTGTNENPVTKSSSALWAEPGRSIRFRGPNGGDAISLGHYVSLFNLRHSIFFFTGISVEDEWQSPPPQMASLAWQPNTTSDECQILFDGSKVIFYVSGAATSGWLHCWSRSG